MNKEEIFVKQLETYFDTVFDKYSRNRILGYLNEYLESCPLHTSPIIIKEKIIYRQLRTKDIEKQENANPKTTPTEILNLVSHASGVTINLMTGKRREEHIVLARHIAIYVIRDLCNFTLKDIGKIFNRAHTTIMASISHVIKMIEVGNESCTKLIGYVHFHLSDEIKQTS